MSEHDPIREWHAQKERAEFVLTVARRVRDGEILHHEAAAALRVAGVAEKHVTKALGDEPEVDQVEHIDEPEPTTDDSPAGPTGDATGPIEE